MTREEKILSLTTLIRIYTAKSVRKYNLKQELGDDLRAFLWIHAIHAVDKYSDTKGANLHTYVEHRIRGAVIDFLRSIDHLKRSQRKQVQKGIAAYEIVSLSLAHHAIPFHDPHPHTLITHNTLQAILNETPLSPGQRHAITLTLNDQHLPVQAHKSHALKRFRQSPTYRALHRV